MVEVTLNGGRAIFEVHGWDKLWSLRSRLEIPLAHIRGVHADPTPAMGLFQGLRLAGTHIPHVFRAGTFYQDGGLVFWDVHDPEKTIMIKLRDEWYKKLIVEVAEPKATIKLITNAINESRKL